MKLTLFHINRVAQRKHLILAFQTSLRQAMVVKHQVVEMQVLRYHRHETTTMYNSIFNMRDYFSFHY